MVARNISWRLSHPPLDVKPSTQRVARRIEAYFAAYPEMSWENFLLSALQKELAFRDWNDKSRKRPLARIQSSETSEPTASRPSLTSSDVRLHALLAARVVALHRPKQDRWPTIFEFLLRNPFSRFVEVYRRMK